MAADPIAFDAMARVLCMELKADGALSSAMLEAFVAND
jgi:hypothetical protein